MPLPTLVCYTALGLSVQVQELSNNNHTWGRVMPRLQTVFQHYEALVEC